MNRRKFSPLILNKALDEYPKLFKNLYTSFGISVEQIICICGASNAIVNNICKISLPYRR